MLNAEMTIAFALPGVGIQSRIRRTANGGLPPQHVSLPAGNAGTLSTRTDANTGVVTLSAGHGVQTGNKVDVYWDGGMRYGMTATVSGNDVTIDAGGGDDLPDESEAVVLTKQVTISLEFNSNNLVVIAAVADQRTHLEFHDGATTSILGKELTADEAWSHIAGMGYANPFGSQVVEEIRASNGSATAVATLKIGGLYDSTS